MTITMQFLEKLVALMDTEDITYELEYQDHNDGEREKGYYLRADRGENNPSPPNRHSGKSTIYRWQAYLRGSFVGMSRSDVVFDLVKMLVEDKKQTNEILHDERVKKAQMAKAMRFLQTAYDNAPEDNPVWIITNFLPYTGGRGDLCEHQYRDMGIEPYKQYSDHAEALTDMLKFAEKDGIDTYYRVVRYFELPEEPKHSEDED